MTSVAPGDTLGQVPEVGHVRISASVVKRGQEFLSTQPGVLVGNAASILDVHGPRRSYTAVEGDQIIGVVTGVFSEEYKVDIRGSQPALLNTLAFENATKRNRPELKQGDLVYARIDRCHLDLEPELTCVDKNGKAAGYGPLKEGFMFESTSQHVLKLRRRPLPPEVRKMPSAIKWDMALGANGRIWVQSNDIKVNVAVAQILQACERLDDEDEVDAIIQQHSMAWGRQQSV